MCHGKPALNSFAINLDANHVRIGIHFAQTREKLNRGNRRSTKAKVNDYRCLNLAKDWLAGNEAIDAAKAIGIGGAPGDCAYRLAYCHSN